MAGADRDSTRDWMVAEAPAAEGGPRIARVGEPVDNGSERSESPQLLEAGRAAADATASAARAAVASDAAIAAVERVERAMAENREAVRLAGEAAVAAERSAATVTAIERRTDRTLKLVEHRIEIVAASADASAELATTVGAGAERLYRSSLEAVSQAHAAAAVAERAGATAEAARQRADEGASSAEQAADRVEEVAERVESVLQARERASVRRAAEAEREREAMRGIDECAERIVQRLRGLDTAS